MKIERSPGLRRAESNREVVPDARDADRPVSSDVDGAVSQRWALARRLRPLLQHATTESSAR